MSVIRSSLGFLTVLTCPPRRTDETMKAIGRHFWWTMPLLEAVIVMLLGSACVLLAKVTHARADGMIAALLMIIDLGVHGFRRLDGFSDLLEGIFYSLSRPGRDRDSAWQVVQSPQNGPYGTAMIVLYLLLEWQLWTMLLSSSATNYFLTACICVGVFPMASVGIAMTGPHRFRTKSDFGIMAGEMGRTARALAALLWCLVLAGLAGLLLNVRFLPVLGRVLPGLLAVAACSAVLCRWLVLWILGNLNGDIIGLTWCVCRVAVLGVLVFLPG